MVLFDMGLIQDVPASVTHMTFGWGFNQPITALPPSLTHLVFGDNFNHRVDSLPSSLTSLTFGWHFNQEVRSLPTVYFSSPRLFSTLLSLYSSPPLLPYTLHQLTNITVSQAIAVWEGLQQIDRAPPLIPHPSHPQPALQPTSRPPTSYPHSPDTRRRIQPCDQRPPQIPPSPFLWRLLQQTCGHLITIDYPPHIWT